MKLDLPATTRDLESELAACGFVRTESGNSHGKWTHPTGAKAVVARGHKEADRSAARDARRAIAISEAIAQGKLDRIPAINARSFKYDAIPHEEELYDQALVRAGRVRPRLADLPDPITVREWPADPPAPIVPAPPTYIAAPADIFPDRLIGERNTYPIILATLNALPEALWAPTAEEAHALAEIQWSSPLKNARTFELADSGFIREGRESIGRYRDGAWIRGLDRSPVRGVYFKAWCQIGMLGGQTGLVWSFEPVRADPSNRTTLLLNDRAQAVAEVDRLDRMVMRAKGDAREAQIDKAARREAIMPAPITAPITAPAPKGAPRGFTIRSVAGQSVAVAVRTQSYGRKTHVEIRPSWAPARASYAVDPRGVVEEVLALFGEAQIATITANQCGLDIARGTLGVVPAVKLSSWAPRMRFRSMPPKSAYYRPADLVQALAAFVVEPDSFWTPNSAVAWPAAIRADSVPFVEAPVQVVQIEPIIAPVVVAPSGVTAPIAPVVEPAPVAPPIAAPVPPVWPVSAPIDPPAAAPPISAIVAAELEALRAELDTPSTRFVLGRAVTLDDVLARVIQAGIAAVRASFGR